MMGQARNTPDKDGSGCKPMYSMQVLMEEVVTLRKRVRDLEEDAMHSGPSDNRVVHDSEVATLRKQLARAQSERADLERDFMNQLTALARENQLSLEKVEQENSRLQCIANSAGDNAQDGEVQTLREGLASADRELSESRRKMQVLEDEVKNLETQKASLVDEVAEIKLDRNNEAKNTMSLRNEKKEMETQFNQQLSKFQADILKKDELIARHKETFADMNDRIHGLETQKNMLVDEISSLRKTLDCEEKSKTNLMARIDELSRDRPARDAENVEKIRVEKRTVAAEEKSLELQSEVDDLKQTLCSMKSSHEAQTAQLMNSLCSTDALLQESKKAVAQKEKALAEAQQEIEGLSAKISELTRKLDQGMKDAPKTEARWSKMVPQRYTKKVIETVSEVEKLRKVNATLTDEIAALTTKLEEEKTVALRLKREVAEKRGSVPVPPRQNTATPPELPTPPTRPQKHVTTPPTTPTEQPPNLTSEPGPLIDSSPRAPVRGIVESFERKISELSPNQKQGIHFKTAFDELVPDPVSADSSDVSCSSSEADDLRQKLEAETELVHLLQEKLEKQCKIIDDLRTEIATLSGSRSSSTENALVTFEQKSLKDEAEIKSLKSQLEDTRASLDNEAELVEELQTEIKVLTSARVSYEEKAMLELEEIESLKSRLEETQTELDNKTKLVEELKAELKTISSERVSREEFAKNTYQKRSVDLRKSNDAEVNMLKIELTKAQMSRAELEREYMNRVKELEDSIEEINAEADEELEEKELQVDELQRQLNEQKEDVSRLLKEREQLCTSMNSMSHTRKDEIDELQAELLEKTSAAAEYKREVQALKMQLECQNDCTAELKELKTKLRLLERNPGRGGASQWSRSEADKLQFENDELRKNVRQVNMERLALQEKLSSVITEQSSSKSLKVLRDRNETLKKEVEKLTKRIKQMEAAITRFSI